MSKADEVVLLIVAGTDYQGFAGRQTKDPLAATLNDLNLASKKSYKSLRKAHIADYQKYFQRVSLQLDPLDAIAAEKPTPERINAAEKGPGDPNLAALYFNFGRYLLISSSRPGGLPPNLQGIWAEEIHTPWTGDWHLDVNVQMNYWPAGNRQSFGFDAAIVCIDCFIAGTGRENREGLLQCAWLGGACHHESVGIHVAG